VAILPASDLVADVLKAADPGQLRQAENQLRALGAGRAAGAGAAREAFSPPVAGHSALSSPAPANDPAFEAHRKFEAMVLQSFLQTMLPKDNEAVYGKGTAGNIWKSMMAEQLANVLADRGGIGIASRLLADAQGASDRAAAFGPVGGPEKGNFASGLLQEIERETFGKILPVDREPGAN